VETVLHFLVVGSVRYIKLTHVGFRAHVKIASLIVSYATSKVWWNDFFVVAVETKNAHRT